jgi:hypothetical protein
MPGAAETDRIDRSLRMSRTKPDAKSRPNAHSFRYSEKGAAVLECALALARASQVWRTPELASTVTTKSISPALPEAAPLRQRAASYPGFWPENSTPRRARRPAPPMNHIVSEY